MSEIEFFLMTKILKNHMTIRRLTILLSIIMFYVFINCLIDRFENNFNIIHYF